MPPTALLADDDAAARAQLRDALRTAWPALGAVHEAGDGADAWDLFLEHEPDVCFLDVRMPGMTGIEVAQRVGQRAPIVFVAAPGEQALAAFAAEGVPYLRKPAIDAAALAEVVVRLQADLAAPAERVDMRPAYAHLAGQVRRPMPLALVPAGFGDAERLVPVADVVYFESDARTTRLVAADGEWRVVAPLKALLAQLDMQEFWQVNRSVVVNRRHIAGAVDGDGGRLEITLLGRGERLPVARTFEHLFRSGPAA